MIVFLIKWAFFVIGMIVILELYEATSLKQYFLGRILGVVCGIVYLVLILYISVYIRSRYIAK